MRWRHPTKGMLLPDKFLPMAEQTKMIREVGMWSIKRAIEDRITIGLDRFPDVAVTVNVSVKQLAEEGFLAGVNQMLAAKSFPPNLLQLELTESSFIENPDKTVILISELRRLGIKVMIDNFGTGYASLSYLKNLPIDGLKIDRNFIKDLPADRGNAAIVQAIFTLASKLGMSVIAEGVETQAEVKGLRSLEIDRMQGAIISEPIPFADLSDLLDNLPALRQMHLAA
jgi:EAL domain-containing protein (putative c-di-GMP-specific phosphodiesterase class I)